MDNGSIRAPEVALLTTNGLGCDKIENSPFVLRDRTNVRSSRRISSKVPGYLLIYTLLMVAIAMGIVTFALSRVTIFGSMSKLMLDRAKARELALGGITLAMSQLLSAEEKKKARKKRLKSRQFLLRLANRQCLKKNRKKRAIFLI